MIDISTPGGFVSGVLFTLDYWIAVHTSPEAWVNNICEPNIGPELQAMFRDGYYLGTKNNGDCFSIPLHKPAYEYLASLTLDMYPDMTLESVTDLLQKQEAVIPLWVMYQVMVNVVYPQVQPYIQEYVGKLLPSVQEAVADMRAAKTRSELLIATLTATNLVHSGGNLLQHYGMKFCSYNHPLPVNYYNPFAAVQQLGLASIIPQKKIDKWLDTSTTSGLIN